MFTAIPITLLSLLALTSAGVLSGNDIISVENYPDIGPNSPDNPPYCGMAWDSLDLSLVTAVQGLTKDQCGTCLLVCGAEPNGCEYILAVDRGGRNLDLSTGISWHIIGTTDGIAWAEWQPVPEVYCSHIYQSGKNDAQLPRQHVLTGVGGNYGGFPNYSKPDDGGNAASASSLSIESTPTTSLAVPGLETPGPVATNYAASTPTTPASTIPTSFVVSYVAPNPTTSSLTDTNFTPTSVAAAPALSTLTTSLLTSTPSAAIATSSSTPYTCPQYLNTTNEANSPSTLLGSGNSTSSGNKTNCFSADLNSTTACGNSNASYNSTSRYMIRGLRWLR
ncbi:MAG: hypothetical protein M1839_004830 [Geoglossum umbratile]|nr:MAG: hypothetical protein M1839_004830 [Geoglossum umbratile]